MPPPPDALSSYTTKHSDFGRRRKKQHSSNSRACSFMSLCPSPCCRYASSSVWTFSFAFLSFESARGLPQTTISDPHASLRCSRTASVSVMAAQTIRPAVTEFPTKKRGA